MPQFVLEESLRGGNGVVDGGRGKKEKAEKRIELEDMRMPYVVVTGEIRSIFGLEISRNFPSFF